MNEQAKKRLSLRGSRRAGFILVTALIIALLGAALSVGIFALAHSMHTTDVVNRESYMDQIDMARYIEEAKGFIAAYNVGLVSSDKAVLHGRGGTTGTYFSIRRLSDLQVCTPDDVAAALSRDDIPLAANLGFERRLRLQVYDANYRIGDVRFTPTPDMPPSLRPSINLLAPAEGGADAYENEGEGIDVGTKEVSGDLIVSDHYKYYGAYLIRAEIFREGQAVPLRRTEEAFFQVVKPN